jgi:hypothetical protein
MKKILLILLLLSAMAKAHAQTASEICLQSSRFILFLKASSILLEKNAIVFLEKLSDSPLSEEEYHKNKLGLSPIAYGLCQAELNEGIKEFVKLNQDKCAHHRTDDEIDSYTKELVNDIDGIKLKSTQDALNALEKRVVHHLINSHKINNLCIERESTFRAISSIELHHPSALICKQIVDIINKIKNSNLKCSKK